MNQGFGLRLGKYEVQSKFGTWVTYEVKTRSWVEVLATSEKIYCLGKHDQCREVKERTGAI